MSDNGPSRNVNAAAEPGLLRREAPRLLGLAVVVALFVIFLVENSRTVRVKFLFWNVNTSLAWALIVAGVLGFAAGLAIAWVRRRHRR